MSIHFAFDALDFCELALSLCAFVLLIRSRSLSVYWPMLPITVWHVVPSGVLVMLRATHALTPQHAYQLYFNTYWASYAIASLSAVFLTYTIFSEALRPLKGLQSLGSIMYRWTAIVSIALAASTWYWQDVGSVDGPSLAAIQLQRLSSVIVLSLITFVGLSLRPLGLSIRSRVFGLSVGVGLSTFSTLLESGKLSRGSSIFSSVNILDTTVSCVALAIWVRYFWVPEPKRRFILLPTTSPYHAWNQISEVLGHDPGYVAIAGIPPESFAPAELDIFGKASRNMAAIDAGEVPPSRPASYYINLEGGKK